MSTGNRYKPDYAIPPGSILKERLEVQGISQAEFARRCGRSPKLISEIIAGKAPLEPKTALQFEKVLGVSANIWIGIEADYQLHMAREAEVVHATAALEWAETFPVQELVKRECFQHPKSNSDKVLKLFEFFGVSSVNAWNTLYSRKRVAFRPSPSLRSSEAALTTWLRLGELEAERQDCENYNESKFKRATSEIRKLTCEPINEALQQAVSLCNQAGVTLALIPPLPKTELSGAAWWHSPRKAVIVLSLRHKSDDQLWFSFFHQTAHIILHSKKNIFIDEADAAITELESEANEWACHTLVPKQSWEKFLANSPRSSSAVRIFANQQGIAPGIVVGMLQHEGHIPWSRLNQLKVQYRWE